MLFAAHAASAAVARLGSLRSRPQQAIAAGAFTPDSKLLAASGSDGAIVFWDTATGKEARRIQAKLPSRLRALRFSADGASLLLAGGGGALRVVDARNGVEQRQIEAVDKQNVLALELSSLPKPR